MTLLQEIRMDYRRYRAHNLPAWIVFLMHGFWATCVYRICRNAIVRARSPLMRRIVRVLGRVAQVSVETITGICLPVECCIEPGLHISHFGLFLGTTCKIGKNCNFHQGITIGRARTSQGFPILGDRIFVGANALILGEITIGSDAVIGAGAVVTRSVPPRAVVVGNPGRIISYKGSFDLVIYDEMNNDPARLTAMNAPVPLLPLPDVDDVSLLQSSP